MAHPFAGKAMSGSKRAHDIAKDYKCGGMTRRASGGRTHSDEAEDKKLFSKLIKKHDAEEKVHGRAAGGRLDKFARGGRAKNKGHHTKININIAPRGHDPAAGVASPAPLGPPPMGGGPLPPPPMAGGPPMGIPPMGPKPPPGLPPGMMKRGGVVKRASGGRLPKAGAETGPGRLEKARLQKSRG